MHNPDVWKIKMMGWLLKQGLTQTMVWIREENKAFSQGPRIMFFMCKLYQANPFQYSLASE